MGLAAFQLCKKINVDFRSCRDTHQWSGSTDARIEGGCLVLDNRIIDAGEID